MWEKYLHYNWILILNYRNLKLKCDYESMTKDREKIRFIANIFVMNYLSIHFKNFYLFLVIMWNATFYYFKMVP